MLRGALVAVALALLVAPASAQALSRTQAEKIAIKHLRPPKGALLHSQLLKRGAAVVEAGPGPETRVQQRGTTLIIRSRFKPVKARTWLFWEDLVPGALFAHPSVLLLIDDRTGRVVRRQTMSFFPLIDGKRPAFLKPGTRPKASAAAIPPNLSIDCMVTIGDRKDPLFTGDFQLAGQIARELKLAKYDANSVQDLELQVRKAAARGCKDVMIVVAAHGVPAQGSNYKHPKTGKAITGSEHAQVVLGYTVSNDAATVTSESFSATHLRDLMRRFPALTFKLVVSSCFSGRWLELSDVANLRVIAVSSRRDQFSFGYMRPGEYDRQSQADATLTVTGDTLTNATTNHTKATTFMNGLLRGLDAWAHTDGRATDDLAKGIVDAFGRERGQDFAAQSGMTNPQLSDNTGPTTAPPPPGPGVAPPANQPPEVALHLATTTAKVGETLHFEGSVSDADGAIKAVLLDFGDGESVDEPFGDHAYTAPGIYTVTLRATDDDGATDTDAQRVFVSGPGTKDAVVDDAPCPGTFDVVVDIYIPSYAQNPTAGFSGTPCVGSSVAIVSATTAGQNPTELDAWGQPRTIYRVTLRVTGGTSTRSTLTVSAHWQ